MEVFLRHGVMTEEFFELYCYAHTRDLIEDGRLSEGDDVLVGWDPRDVEKFYVSRAVSGVAKAGGRPVLLGVFPTPGIAISTVCLEVATAIVITASHNPRDNNGIKIFMGPNAAKLMPDDDRRLTQKIYATDYEVVRKAEEKFHPFDASEHERNSFLHFHLDERNSWVNISERTFSRSDLIVDSAHGALAWVAPKVFSELGFGKVSEVASEQNGDVNKDSGVAYFEGVGVITGSSFDSGSGISRHKLIQKMFAAGRSPSNAGTRPLLGASFDADGDRFLLLIYDKSADAVRVLTGDDSLALQSSYLMATNPGRWNGRTLAFTVESDINLARHAESVGFAPIVTAVGDKWILQKANESEATFGIGGEETGHSISCGVTTLACREEKQIFTGNGLKGAINTFLALHKLAVDGDVLKVAREPFEAGFRHTSYAYYVNKSLFFRGSKLWGEVEETVRRGFSDSFSTTHRLSFVEIDGEADMLYARIEDDDGRLVGAVFVRNSGTENKTSVNARGGVGMQNGLKNICEVAIALIIKRMKDKGDAMASAQARLIKMISQNERPDAGAFAGVDFERLLYETEVKEKLIVLRGGNYGLTRLGEGCVG